MSARITNPNAPELAALHIEWSALRASNRTLSDAERDYSRALGARPHLVHQPNDPTHHTYNRALRAQNLAYTAYRAAIDDVHRTTGAHPAMTLIQPVWEEQARTLEANRIMAAQ